MKSSRTLWVFTYLFVLYALPALAWLRWPVEDVNVVSRSELIVVAHLRDGTLKFVPHTKKSDEGASWEHHASLVIAQVLKGQCDTNEIPVIIHYGLEPVVGGYVKRDNFMLNHRGNRNDYPKDIIEIADSSDKLVEFKCGIR